MEKKYIKLIEKQNLPNYEEVKLAIELNRYNSSKTVFIFYQIAAYIFENDLLPKNKKANLTSFFKSKSLSKNLKLLSPIFDSYEVKKLFRVLNEIIEFDISNNQERNFYPVSDSSILFIDSPPFFNLETNFNSEYYLLILHFLELENFILDYFPNVLNKKQLSDSVYKSKYDAYNRLKSKEEHSWVIAFSRVILYFKKNYEITNINNNVEEKKLQKILDSSNPNILKKIQESFIENKEEVIIDSIIKLVGDVNFLELIISNKIIFSSKDEPILSKQLCSSLIELSERKGFRKAGNPSGGLNTILPANDFAKKIGPLLEGMEEKGIKTYQAMSDVLNNRKIKTIRNNEWSRSTVKRTYERWKKLKTEDENKKVTPTKKSTPE